VIDANVTSLSQPSLDVLDDIDYLLRDLDISFEILYHYLVVALNDYLVETCLDC